MGKRNIVKRSIGVLIAVVIMFSFLGCQSLQAYKANAKLKLEYYASELSYFEGGKFVKNHISGPALDKIVDNGKDSIDSASSRKAVKREFNNAKRTIDALPIVFSMEGTFTAWDEFGNKGFKYLFYLERIEEEIFFDCITDNGMLQVFAVPDEPLSPEYGGFYGRHPIVMLWHIGFGQGFPDKGNIAIVMRIDEVAIGYMVVGMSFVGTGYVPKLLAVVLNPKIGNEYQSMDEKEVWADIESIENNN